MVLTLRERFPRISSLPKQIITSGIENSLAIISDPRKLSIASFLSSRIGIYEPVITTGLFRFSRMNDKVLAVYVMVSVPWMITNPS